jgi:hypothetical protein
MFDKKDETEQAIELLRSGNMVLADKLKTLIHSVIDKANVLVHDTDNTDDLVKLMRTAEIAAKAMGLAPTESVTNVSINAISGFVYIVDDTEPTRQIETVETFDSQLPTTLQR